MIATEPGSVCLSTTRTILLITCVLCLKLTTTVHAARIQPRSYNSMEFRMNPNGQMHMADGMLRDLMMLTADHNNDSKFSEDEIAWFYRNVVLYNDYVSQQYGHKFVEYADTDNDGLLNPDELLSMLVAMEA